MRSASALDNDKASDLAVSPQTGPKSVKRRINETCERTDPLPGHPVCLRPPFGERGRAQG